MSNVNRDTAMAIWKAAFGDEEWAKDCFGTWMCRDDYGEHEKTRLDPDGSGKRYYFGWDIDHIRPISSFDSASDADFLNNYEPEHWQNNAEKSDSYPPFKIGSREYTVVKCEICGNNGVKGYGILDKAKNARVDWKAKTSQYYSGK